MKVPTNSPGRPARARPRHKAAALLATGVAVSLSVVGSTGVSSASPHADATTQPLVVWVDSTRCRS